MQSYNTQPQDDKIKGEFRGTDVHGHPQKPKWVDPSGKQSGFLPIKPSGVKKVDFHDISEVSKGSSEDPFDPNGDRLSPLSDDMGEIMSHGDGDEDEHDGNCQICGNRGGG